MHPCTLSSLTSHCRNDSKSVYVCMHKCVRPAPQTLCAKSVQGLEKHFWSVGDGVKAEQRSGRRHTE